MIVENVKEFLKSKGLNWTGDIIRKGKNFRPATIEDFKNLEMADYLINFGNDGEIALTIEIDDITFKIYGESYDIAYSCYAGENEENKKLCEERDLTKEWIQFQLEKSGLIYAAALRIKCQQKIDDVNKEKEKRKKQLERKIEYLQRSIDKTEENAEAEIKKIKKIEKLADKFEKEI